MVDHADVVAVDQLSFVENNQARSESAALHFAVVCECNSAGGGEYSFPVAGVRNFAGGCECNYALAEE